MGADSILIPGRWAFWMAQPSFRSRTVWSFDRRQVFGSLSVNTYRVTAAQPKRRKMNSPLV